MIQLAHRNVCTKTQKRTQSNRVTYYGLLVFNLMYLTYKFYTVNCHCNEHPPSSLPLPPQPKLRMHSRSPFSQSQPISKSNTVVERRRTEKRMQSEPLKNERLLLFCCHFRGSVWGVSHLVETQPRWDGCETRTRPEFFLFLTKKKKKKKDIKKPATVSIKTYKIITLYDWQCLQTVYQLQYYAHRGEWHASSSMQHGMRLL